MEILFYLLCLIWIVQEIALALRDRGKIPLKRDPTNILLQIYIVVGINISIFFSFFPFFHISTQRDLVLGFACFFIALGISIRLWAVYTLGKYFRRVIVIQKDHKLIMTGPYAYIRHPSYLGSLLSFLGFGIACNSFISILFLELCVGYAFLVRMNLEEKALLHSFRQRYESYTKHTKRLLPFLY